MYSVLLNLGKLLFSIIIFEMLCESSWKKQHSILEQDASNISILKKQISKQAEIDTSVQLSIADKIDRLKQGAVTLAKKLQNEKHKNNELQAIIKYIKSQMESEKMLEATHREDLNYESIVSLQNRYKKIEYDLGHINGKVNRLSENVEQKRTKINQNRMERVIDSGIFRNIEKELIDSELNFKKLLIQKIKYERQYEKLMSQYGSLKEKAESYQKHQQIRKGKFSSDNQLNQPNQQPSGDRKFIELQINKALGNHKGSTLTFIQEQNQAEAQHQIIRIKKLLIETGLANCEELLHHFNLIQEINQKYFNQMNIYSDQSNQIQKYLAEMSKTKRNGKLKFYQSKKQPTKQQLAYNECQVVKDKIQQLQLDVDRQNNEINMCFKQKTFQQFIKEMNVPTCSNDDTSDAQIHPDDLKNTLQMLQKNIQQYLSHNSTVPADRVETSRSPQKFQKLDELIGKVRKHDECLKVMKKQQFQEQYRKIIKNPSQKNVSSKTLVKRRSQGALRNK